MTESYFIKKNRLTLKKCSYEINPGHFRSYKKVNGRKLMRKYLVSAIAAFYVVAGTSSAFADKDSAQKWIN